MNNRKQMRSYSDEEIKQFMNSRPITIIGLVCSSIMITASFIELYNFSSRKQPGWVMISALQLLLFTVAFTVNIFRLQQLRKSSRRIS